MAKTPEKRIMTPEFRVSFPSVFEPSCMTDAKGTPTGKPKYGVTMLFPKSTDLSALKELMKSVVEEKFPDPAKRPKGLRNPFRDGNEKDNLDGYADHIFIAARSMNKPGVVDQNVKAIIDPNEFYAGCYARAYVTAYYYDTSGNKGVAFSLQTIQKVREGEPFAGGRAKAEDDFGPVSEGAASAGAAKVEAADDGMFA